MKTLLSDLQAIDPAVLLVGMKRKMAVQTRVNTLARTLLASPHNSVSIRAPKLKTLAFVWAKHEIERVDPSLHVQPFVMHNEAGEPLYMIRIERSKKQQQQQKQEEEKQEEQEEKQQEQQQEQEQQVFISSAEYVHAPAPENSRFLRSSKRVKLT